MESYLLGYGLMIVLCGVESTLLDMTHTFDNTSICWPNGQAAFELKIIAKGLRSGGFWYQGDDITSGNHVGTHMDAPCHFYKDRWCIDEIPIGRLVDRPVVMIDIRQKVAQSPDVNVTLDDVKRFEAKYGKIPPGAVVMQCSGWSDKYPDVAAVFGNDREDTSDFHFPAFSAAAADFLIEQRGIVGLAVDTPSVDYGQSDSYPVHIHCCNHNLYLLENVKDTCLLPAVGATLTSLPSKIRGSSGAATRVVASWTFSVSRADRVHYRFNFVVVLLTLFTTYFW